MSELFAALIGGIISLLATIYAIRAEFRNSEKVKQEDYRNDIVSMIDVVIHNAAKVRNNELNYTNACYNKEFTQEIYSEIVKDFLSLDELIQETIMKMSHHIKDSNKEIKEMLVCFEPVETQFKKFKVSNKIYTQKFEKKYDDKFTRNLIASSKGKLDETIGKFINDLTIYAKNTQRHEAYKPKLNDIMPKENALKIDSKGEYVQRT